MNKRIAVHLPPEKRTPTHAVYPTTLKYHSQECFHLHSAEM